MISDNDDITTYRFSEHYTDTRKKPRPQFKLCFGTTQEIGRSPLSKVMLGGLGQAITSKFYSKHDRVDFTQVSEDELKIQPYKKGYRGPMDKYEIPVLESHLYGWYNKEAPKMNTRHPKLHFPQRRSDMVKIQCILSNASKAERQFQQLRQNVNISQNK